MSQEDVVQKTLLFLWLQINIIPPLICTIAHNLSALLSTYVFILLWIIIHVSLLRKIDKLVVYTKTKKIFISDIWSFFKTYHKPIDLVSKWDEILEMSIYRKIVLWYWMHLFRLPLFSMILQREFKCSIFNYYTNLELSLCRIPNALLQKFITMFNQPKQCWNEPAFAILLSFAFWSYVSILIS